MLYFARKENDPTFTSEGVIIIDIFLAESQFSEGLVHQNNYVLPVAGRYKTNLVPTVNIHLSTIFCQAGGGRVETLIVRIL